MCFIRNEGVFVVSFQDKEEAARHLSRMLFLALTLGLGLLIVTEVWVTELLQGMNVSQCSHVDCQSGFS